MMNHPIPGFMADSDQARLMDTADAMHEQAVESHTDYLLGECKEADYCADLVNEYDLYDGDFLPSLMTEIANWTGSMESSHQRMKAMYNLLADELQKMAEKEFA